MKTKSSISIKGYIPENLMSLFHTFKAMTFKSKNMYTIMATTILHIKPNSIHAHMKTVQEQNIYTQLVQITVFL